MVYQANIDKIIRQITNIMIRYYDPDKVILFGSFAKGTAHDNSDLDLLIIKETSVPKRYRGMDFRGIFAEFPISIDLVFLTPSEYEEERKQPYSFFYSVNHAKQILYDKNG